MEYMRLALCALALFTTSVSKSVTLDELNKKVDRLSGEIKELSRAVEKIQSVIQYTDGQENIAHEDTWPHVKGIGVSER